MRTDTRIAVLAALGCGVLAAAGPTRAAGGPPNAAWNGSYAADGACHCAGELDPGVAARPVDTPLGERSVAAVCAAIGPGPALRFEDGAWNRTVYPDAQCGNGPFASGVELLDASCAGTRRPGQDDCRPVGPRWDLESAFVATSAAADAGGTAREAGGSVAPDSELASAAPGTVQIDGRSWRRAPDGTPRSGGRPGSRIVLDGELWLQADDPRFAEADADAERARRAAVRREAGSREVDYVDAEAAEPAPPPAPEVAAAEPGPASARRWKEAPAEPAVPVADADAASPRRWQEAPEEPTAISAEAYRARQRALVAERRALEARETAADEARPDALPGSSDESAVLAAALPAGPPAVGDDGSDATDGIDAPVADAADAAPSPVEESANAVAATAPGEASAEGAAPLAALRLPADVRASSGEFGYVEAMPMSYDIGGGGLGLEASAEARNRFHFLARVGAASSYREVALGAGMHVTPADADRLTFALTGGVEYGAFELVGTDANGEQTLSLTDDEAGLFVSLSSRLVVNSRFELSGGVGYSSFHDGDPHGFGGAFFHITRRLDLLSRFEVGDNDQLGIGLRYYY